MIAKPDLTGGFGHVEVWVFDLDNTLYPADCNLFAEIDTRMGDFIADRFGVSHEEAQRMRKAYCYQYGTTLAGLMRLHDVCPNAFLDYVHDIDLSVIAPAPELRDAFDALPGRKFVFTNGSRKHAESVISRLGLDGRFDDVFDIHAAEFIPKPERAAYERFMGAHAVAAPNAAMFDDLPHNLRTAHELGMTTVLVACGHTDHPEHRAIAGWGELPSHIHHRTDALASFLADIEAARAEEVERATAAGAYCCL
ncbi:MAG TPA: pyrimidine 5'-nucleotidase [Methyloceanibacter sp.]|jgi:putative hydrolase of the HAD superfamily|nr:pyrimidine 5'-nucleotidase [Methyloceanibacter sp.]